MRRAVVAAMLGLGLLGLAACGDDADGSTEAVCERMETEGTPAMDRFQTAGQDLGAALSDGDQAAAATAAGEAQNAAGDYISLLREGAEDADDEALSTALATLADELETYIGGLDPGRLVAGEQPDSSQVDTAFDELDSICGA